MAPKNKPYEQFGPYILFKKLESDALSELWRAARVENGQLGGLFALRRFTGGNREALAASATTAKSIATGLSGTSFAKNQTLDVINGTPFIAHEYSGGRSLRHIVDRARGGNGLTPNPIPIDQAIVIAEKVALSLATTADLRFGGDRLTHGALIPQFVWITDDGEIRVAGQQLGAGMIASLKDARVASEIGRYFAPEYQSSGQPTKSSEVYSMGAMLYLLVTGAEPPDGMTASAFTNAVHAAKTTTGAPMPDDIRAIIDKSLTLDAAPRYGSMGDMKQAISALATGGKYSATTFNLAFYMSNLLKKEFESESLDRDKESKVNVVPYAEALQPVAALPASHEPSAPMFASVEEGTRKSKAPMAIAAALIAGGIGFGVWYMSQSKPAPKTTPKALTTAAIVPMPKTQIVSQPLVAATPATSTSTSSSTTTSVDEAARKKAFEEAVQKKLQDEMMKLQTDYKKSLQQQQAKNAPVQVASSSAAPAPATTAPAPQREEPSAAQLDQQRMQSRSEPAASPVQPATQAPSAAVAQRQETPAAPVPTVRVIHEGDVIDVGDLDTVPSITRRTAPIYPPMALRQRIEATVLVTALVSENGDVLEVKILRGDPRFGFEDAALRAVRATKFSPAMKDGKRVKTWFPLPVAFKL